jgi:hypothetical protein
VTWLATTVGWGVLWLVALGLAMWQVVRGRTLAGLALGVGALVGMVMLVVPSLLDLGLPMLADLVGWSLAFAARRLVLGLGDAVVVALLIAGAVLQRSPAA